MSFGGIKRTPADKAFSDAVREAHDYECQRCHTNLRHNPRAMHLSHFKGRRSKSTRWDKNNGFCLCAACHNYLGENPDEHTHFARMVLGDALFEITTQKAARPYKLAKGEEDEIKKHYQEQLKEIRRKRAQGQVGYIDFISYY